MKNRGPPVAQILHPAVFHFKEGRVLAEHPLICHHQGVFGCPESAKKMREKGNREEQKRGSFPPKIYYSEVIDCHLLQTEAYICSEKGKLQNNMKQQNYSEGRKEKNQNGVVWIKNRGNNFRYAQ